MILEGVIYARTSTPTYLTGSLPSCSFAQLHHDLTSHGARPELGIERRREREREREREKGREPGGPDSGMTSNDTMNNSL